MATTTAPDSVRQLNVRLTDQKIYLLKRIAELDDRSVNQWLNDLITRELSQRQDELRKAIREEAEAAAERAGAALDAELSMIDDSKRKAVPARAQSD